jgi:hypothetical protein
VSGAKPTPAVRRPKGETSADSAMLFRDETVGMPGYMNLRYADRAIPSRFLAGAPGRIEEKKT